VTAEVENLILERLRRIDARLDGIEGGLRETKDRIGHIERYVGELAMQYVSISTRMECMDLRIERIERRLELTEA
jgi:hypothetical protein